MILVKRPEDINKINAGKLLKMSLKNSAPLDVPTVILTPEQFKGLSNKDGKILRFSRTDMLDVLESRLKNVFNNSSYFSENQSKEIITKYLTEASEELMTQIVSNIVIPQHIQSGCVPFPFMGIKGPFAHDFNEKDYTDPKAAIVFTFCDNVDGKAYGESMMSLAPGELPEMPGTKEEWQFMLLWHEFAHTAGACEPQADKIAAIVTKQAFGKNDVIDALADQRMVTSILNYNKQINTEYYGLPLVESVDLISQTKQSEIDNVSRDTLKRIRFEKPNYQADKLRAVGNVLNQSLSDIFETVKDNKKPIRLKDLKLIRDETTNALNNNAFKGDQDSIKIAKRLILAVDRLTEGKNAYKHKKHLTL